MKKITFILSLLISALGFSQSLPLDFSDTLDEFIGEGSMFSIVNVAGDDVGRIVGGSGTFDNIQLTLANFVDVSDTSNNTITFDITVDFGTQTPEVRNHLFKLEGEENGGFDIEVPFSTTISTMPQTITLDFDTATNSFPNNGNPTVTLGSYSKIVIFTDFNANTTATYDIDDIAGALDGGAVPMPIPPPATNAPELPSTGTDLYVYSGLTGDAVTNFNYYAFGNTGVPEVDIEMDAMNPNNAGRIDGNGFFFYGAEWDAEDLEAQGFQFVHLNYYSTTSTEFSFYLIDETAGINGGLPEEPRYRFGGATPDAAIVTGSWQSVFIPLQHFLDYDSGTFSYDLNDIFQYKFDGLDQVYFDNIFFSTTNVLSTDNFAISQFSVFPNPTKNVWNIESNTAVESVEVFDLLGKNVLTLTPNSQNVAIDASNLKTGIYLALVTSNGATNSIKLVKN